MNLTNAIRKALKDSGAPLSLDDLMEQLPEGSDRHTVGARCRGLKDAGEITSSVEDGKVAYSWAGGKPAVDRKHTLTDRIREILRSAAAPMTAAEVCAALPDDKDDSIQALLSQRARAGDFAVVSAGGRKLAYALAGSGGVSVAVNVNTVAPAPASTPAPPHAPPAPAPATATPAAKKPVTMHPGISVVVAERAERRAELGKLLDESVNNAEAAREAYVLSVVEPGLYAWMQASVRAAHAARDAFAGSATT